LLDICANVAFFSEYILHQTTTKLTIGNTFDIGHKVIMFALNFKLPLILWYCTKIVFGDYNLHLLHVNDIHARFEQTNKYSGRCKPEDAGNAL
jgi:hypothetical protein